MMGMKVIESMVEGVLDLSEIRSTGDWKKVKKCMSWGSALGLIVLLTTACLGSTDGKTTEPGSGATAGESQTGQSPDSQKPREPVKLVFYSTAGWTQEAFNERFGEAIRAKFPEYTIEYVTTGQGTSLSDMVASGAQIDVFWQAYDLAVNQMKEYRLHYDMSDLVRKHKVDLTRIEPASLENVREQSDGLLYALPIIINTAGFYYNKDVFDQFGIGYPRDGMTWQEVIDLGRSLFREDSGKQYYGIGYNARQVMDMNAFSLPYVAPATGKATILSDDRWATIYDTLLMASRTTADSKLLNQNNLAVEQNLGMYAALANLFLNVDLSNINWDMISYPTWPGQNAGVGPQPYPTLFGITSTSKHPDEAMEVLNYLLSAEVQLSLSQRGIIPAIRDEAVKKAFGSQTKYSDKNLQAIISKPFAPLMPRPSYATTAQPVYSAKLTPLLSGEIDRNTAFRQIDEEVANKVAEEKAK